MWRSPPPEYAELPPCRPRGAALGDRQNATIPDDPHPKKPHTRHNPTDSPHRSNRHSTRPPTAPTIASGGPGGQGPPGAAAPPRSGGGAAAKHAGVSSSSRTERRSKSRDKPESAGARPWRGVPGGGAPRARESRRGRAAALPLGGAGGLRPPAGGEAPAEPGLPRRAHGGGGRNGCIIGGRNMQGAGGTGGKLGGFAAKSC